MRDYSAWNEANHTSQPTSKKPKMAARYYNAMRQDCRSCTIVAADVLDSKDMLAWVKKFKRYAPSARIWGLHNYKDANDAAGTTKLLLKAVKGQVWLTETGGILRLKPSDGSRGGRKHTKGEQAKAVVARLQDRQVEPPHHPRLLLRVGQEEGQPLGLGVRRAQRLAAPLVPRAQARPAG